jgi:hypothetical protein
MLNRLTLPQLKDLASQMSVPVTTLAEKEWIVEDILEALNQPIGLSQVHDVLLTVEKATDNPSIANARQLVKEYCQSNQ